jgi:hypothetical protein
MAEDDFLAAIDPPVYRLSAEPAWKQLTSNEKRYAFNMAR